jgi:hypothetical protein
VRAEHLFLLTLIYTYTEDYKGVQSEYEEFRRYSFFLSKILPALNSNIFLKKKCNCMNISGVN